MIRRCVTMLTLGCTALVLAGCGGGSAVPPASSAPASPTAVGSPRTWTQAEACAYLRKAKDANTAANVAYNATDAKFSSGQVSWTKARAAARAAAAATREYVQKLRKPPHPWPTDMASDIASVAKFRLAVSGGLDQMGMAANRSAFDHYYAEPWASQSLTDEYNVASQSLKVTCGT